MNKTYSLSKEQAEMIDTAYKKGYEQGKSEEHNKISFYIKDTKAEERERILKLIEEARTYAEFGLIDKKLFEIIKKIKENK